MTSRMEGGEGVGKNVTVCDVGEEGRYSNRDVTLQLLKNSLKNFFGGILKKKFEIFLL
jgi:hypothetical protein